MDFRYKALNNRIIMNLNKQMYSLIVLGLGGDLPMMIEQFDEWRILKAIIEQEEIG